MSAFREVVKKKDAYLLMIGMFDDANTIEAELRKWAEGSKHVILLIGQIKLKNIIVQWMYFVH